MSCRFNPGGDFVLENEIMDTPQEAKVRHDPRAADRGVQVHEAEGRQALRHPCVPCLEHGRKRVLSGTRPHPVQAGRRGSEGNRRAYRVHQSVGRRRHPLQAVAGAERHHAIGEGVHRAFDEVLVPAGMDDVSIYTEMGRFILGPYGALVAKCIHHKHTYKEYAGLDACAANLMRPAMYGAYHHITVMGKENEPCDHKYDVTGSLCENNDKFAIDRMLPKIDMGDILVIHDTGAHGFSMGYNYNGKLRSAELLLKEDGSVEMIRRAETPKDYFATF